LSDFQSAHRPRMFGVVSTTAVAILVLAACTQPGQGTAAPRQHVTSAFQAVSFAKDPGTNGGEGSVVSPNLEQYDNRAYPSTTIGYQQVITSQQAFAAVQNHARTARVVTKATVPSTSTSGSQVSSSWQLIGPSSDKVNGFFLGYTPGDRGAADIISSGRVTSIAVSPGCSASACRVWVGAAGGGIWIADNGLAATPTWRSSSTGLTSNAIGSITLDPSNANIVYVGTGEPNGSSDSEAGVGLFKSTNGGASWSLISGSVPVSKDRAIGAVLVDPSNGSHLYIGTDVARHGLSSVAGGRYTPPGAPSLGVYESKDGGATWSHVLNPQPQDVVVGNSSNGLDFYRGGVPTLAFDPTDHTTVYAATFGYGVWRSAPSLEAGDPTFKQVAKENNSADATGERSNIAVASHTRVYLVQGGDQPGQLWRTDSANHPAATLTGASGKDGWQLLSSPTKGTPGFASFDFCTAQCWYDSPIASPAGHPDTVWIGGSMQYGELNPHSASNGRAVQRSTDGGVSFTDMTDEFQTPPVWLHPDEHAIAFDPNNPEIAFIGNDGGMYRTGGTYSDSSSSCTSRGLTGLDLIDCQHWLSAIPTHLSAINAGLATLQFQSLSLNPQNPNDVLGGTQDNGTLAFKGSNASWFETINGDGGQSGTDAKKSNIRIHTYYVAQADVNFHGTQTIGWDWVADKLLASHEAASFYIPVLTDPSRSGTIFVGLQHVWRTQDSAGSQAFLDAHCNEFGIPPYGSDQAFTGNCGDWQTIGPDLTTAALGTKGGSYVVAISRGASRNAPLWVGTRRGRIFISTNADSANPAAVTFTRIDSAAQPNRFPSSIAVDPENPYHAFVSFSGYNAYTLNTPGHVFEVTVNKQTGVATWVDRSYDLGDQPITSVALDANTGDLYASTDFGVLRLANRTTSWQTAAAGLPPVAVYGLTINSDGQVLYAATHGRSAYRLDLSRLNEDKRGNQP
jgi:hypothetical protein